MTQSWNEIVGSLFHLTPSFTHWHKCFHYSFAQFTLDHFYQITIFLYKNVIPHYFLHSHMHCVAGLARGAIKIINCGSRKFKCQSIVSHCEALCFTWTLQHCPVWPWWSPVSLSPNSIPMMGSTSKYQIVLAEHHRSGSQTWWVARWIKSWGYPCLILRYIFPQSEGINQVSPWMREVLSVFGWKLKVRWGMNLILLWGQGNSQNSVVGEDTQLLKYSKKNEENSSPGHRGI